MPLHLALLLIVSTGVGVGIGAYWTLRPSPPTVVEAAAGRDHPAAPAAVRGIGPSGDAGQRPAAVPAEPEPAPVRGIALAGDAGQRPAAVPAEVAAAVQRAVDPSECAQLEFVLGKDGTVVELTGVAETAAVVNRVAGAVRAVDGVGDVAAGAVAVYPQPFCAALGTLRNETVQPAPPAGIALWPNRSDAVYRDGDLFALTVAMPGAAPGYLYVDHVDEDGNVVHLVPSPAAPHNLYGPGEAVRLGAADAEEARATGRRTYQVTPPFGVNLLIAIASPKPLFDEARAEVEDADAYLAELAERLKGIDSGFMPVSAARFIETKPRED